MKPIPGTLQEGGAAFHRPRRRCPISVKRIGRRFMLLSVAQLEADWALHGVPIVFITALITPEEARDGRRINGHRIAAKPHIAAELIRLIEENLPCCAQA